VHRIELPKGRDINEYVCALAGKNPKTVASALEGLMVDAPILARPVPSKSKAGAVTESKHTRDTSSSLAANLAAEEKSLPGKTTVNHDVPVVRKGADVQINVLLRRQEPQA
jgi:hypothetical protein